MCRFTTLGMTTLLAFAPVALAVDGTVLINQSTITNGLPGCPTGGHFPIIICQAGSYKLSSNLIVPDANTGAINISADNVTLDLNGFSILGPVVCSGTPLSCSPTNRSGDGISSANSNITVSNGTIRGLGGSGINLTGSGVRIEGVKAVSNGFDGITVDGPGLDAIITLCQANSNGNSGFHGEGTVSNSSAVFNLGVGMNWSGTVTGSISNFNGSGAINGVGVFVAISAVGNFSGITAPGPSVIISNTLINNGASKITAPNGSIVLNNVALP